MGNVLSVPAIKVLLIFESLCLNRNTGVPSAGCFAEFDRFLRQPAAFFLTSSFPEVTTIVTPRIISSTATISCRPSTMNTPVPAENACTREMVRCTSAVKVTQSIITKGGIRVLSSLPVIFRNTHRVIRTSALRS